MQKRGHEFEVWVRRLVWAFVKTTGGATTSGPDATHPPTIFQNLGGGAVGGGGSSWGSGGGAGSCRGRGGGVFLPGVGGGGSGPGVRGASSQG